MSELLVYVVCANEKEAQKIAETVVRKKLAACANVLGECRSFYWWKGKFEECNEAVVVMKTTSGKYKQLEHAIRQMHSYENPVVVALPISRGSAAYLKWVRESVSGNSA